MSVLLGWDIGGVNTKAALVARGRLVASLGMPYELQRAPGDLARVLRGLAARLLAPDGPHLTGGPPPTERPRHLVTMTAELSQLFRSKAEGVSFVLDAVEAAFGRDAVLVYAVDGRYVTPDTARREPLAVAAANWSATARVVGRVHANAVLVDTGTTTTDVIPIVDGRVAALGWTDPARLASGELVYTGVVRTPVEAVLSHVSLGGRSVGVSAEGFALVGDVHVWRGDLAPGAYSVPTPDGRPADRPWAGERLRRVVCADPTLLDEDGVDHIAAAVAASQVERIREAIDRVQARHPAVRTAVVAGLGAFLGAAAAHQAGLSVAHLSDALGGDGSEFAPAAAVALLFDSAERLAPVVGQRPSDGAVDVVVKIGGSLLRHGGALRDALDTIGGLSEQGRVLVVPGGGELADAVRRVDALWSLSDGAAHWMAVRAMDEMAGVLADGRRALRVVRSAPEVRQAIKDGKVPVLAPFAWLREVDPLPHSWDVTSDSIAAWVAGALGARRLVLLKAPFASGSLVDGYFERVRPHGVVSQVVTADDLDALRAACREP